MYGGLKKSASRLALVAAAGVLSTNAFAADLGGDCCADLEERVAELEATTARKGTRKTSLEIWGLVNKEVIAWNDGINKNVELGTDNVNQSTRFGLRGNAKITPSITAGYSIMIEIASGGRSTNVNQLNDKQGIGLGAGTVLNPANGMPQNNTLNGSFGVNDQAITARESIWWLESKQIGRLTVGRLNTGADGGPTGTIDLGGIGLQSAGASSVNDTGLVFRTNAPAAALFAPKTGNVTNYTNPNTTDSNGEYATRQNAVLYTSPVIAGFTVSASLGNAAQTDNLCQTAGCSDGVGPIWSAGVKYANEFAGFRVAASYGHEDSNNANATSMFGTNGTSPRPHSTNDGIGLALLHVPTGLFVQGEYNWFTRGHDAAFAAVTGASSDTARQFQIQGGISKNWFGLGNTVPYVEYQQVTNGYNTFGLEGAGAAPSSATGFGVAYFGDNTTNKLWGLGVVQYVDAAAMQLYAGYRDHSISSANCTAAGGCKDIGIFVTGARIQF